MVRVDQCMTPHPVTVTPSSTLDVAAQTMVERGVGAAIAMEGGKVVGMITERDLLRAVARGLVPWNTKVADVMTPDPVTVEPPTSSEHAMSLMLEGRFRHLPVVDNGRLIGIVSLRDLASETERVAGVEAVRQPANS